MASAQVVEMSVTNKSPSQDSNHPDDLFQSRNNHKVAQNTNMYVVSFPSAECYKTVLVMIIIIIINLNFEYFFIIFKI